MKFINQFPHSVFKAGNCSRFCKTSKYNPYCGESCPFRSVDLFYVTFNKVYKGIRKK